VILKYLRCFAKICAAGNNSLFPRRTTQFTPPPPRAKYNKTITVLCVGKHPDLSTLGELFSPQVAKSGCFPTQRAVIVYCHWLSNNMKNNEIAHNQNRYKMTDDSIMIYLMWGTIEKSVIMANKIHYIYLRLYLLDQ
jgi:hypothetical protein